MIYLDSASSSKVATEVLEEITYVTTELYGNSSSRTHAFGTLAGEKILTARKAISSLTGDHAENLCFTSGATESNNLAILGFRVHFSQNDKPVHVISSTTEHKSVLEPLRQLERESLVSLTLVQPKKNGHITAQSIKEALTPETKLISVMHVNNETGAKNEIEEIANLLQSHSAYLHVDAAQSFGKYKLSELKNKRIDMISVSSHKMFGPQGIGGLILRRRNFSFPPLSPLILGGGQERGLRSGTLPTPLVAGFGKAVELSQRNQERWLNEVRKQRQCLLEALKEFNPVELTRDGSPYILNVSLPGVDSEAAMLALKNTAAVSNGSACTSHSYKPSHVLLAMGVDESATNNALRFSFSPYSDIPKKLYREIASQLRLAKE